jgi:hypothetical protein
MPNWPFQTAQDRTDAMLGTDDSNNAQATTNVAANADGSLLERAEYIQTTQAVPTADAATDTLMRDVVGRKTDAGIQAVTTNKSEMAYIKGILDILAGTAGITSFPAASAAANAVSLAEVIRYIQESQIGTLANTGGTATLAGLIGDLANSSLLARLNLIQGLTPSTYVPGLGFRVTKTENVNTATGVDLFTVTGKVLIRIWTGEVTNALGTQPVDYKLRIKTDNVDLCAATDIASAALGYMFQLSSDAGLTLLTGSSYAVTAVKTADTNGLGMADRIVGLAGGTCTLQSLRTAGDVSDAIIHSIYYLPLEASATIVAA